MIERREGRWEEKMSEEGEGRYKRKLCGLRFFSRELNLGESEMGKCPRCSQTMVMRMTNSDFIFLMASDIGRRVKLVIKSLIILSGILTFLFGIYQVTWHLREYFDSESFTVVWNYGLFNYPRRSILGQLVNITLSLMFLQGILLQFISFKDVKLSSIYTISIALMIFGLFGSWFISMFGYGLMGESYFYYEEYIFYPRTLPGFYWGLLSIFWFIVNRVIKERVPSFMGMRDYTIV